MRRNPTVHRWPLLAGVLLLLGGTAVAGPNSFCGGAAAQGDPTDLANVVGDQTLEYAAQQPAGIVTCAKGYLLAKCGDYETANKVFDKCIAAGYAGAMIWKALLLEEGAGVAPDLAEAARLVHRAATSGDPAYGPLGKMHYATMLHVGKGVPRDEAAARRWFEAAAAEGSEEAREFLRTGYHTGERDLTTLGAGTPPPSALVRGLTGDNASVAAPGREFLRAAVDREKTPISTNRPAAPLPGEPPATQLPRPEAEPATLAAPAGQRLTAARPDFVHSLSAESLWTGLLLLLAFAVGLLRQRAAPRHVQPLPEKHA